MSVRQQVAVVITAIAALATVAALVMRSGPAAVVAPVLGATAPPFSVRALDGSGATRTLESYRGKVLILNVWATWCVPCKVEMPSFERLYQRYRDHGLVIVAVSIDGPGKERAILDFGRQLGLSFELAHDPDGNIETAYQTTGAPETFVIDTAGVLVKRVAGAEDWMSAANQGLIAGLLGVPVAEPAVTPAAPAGSRTVTPSGATAPARGGSR